MAGLTQTALAERLFFSRSTVANVERGRQPVRREFWERADAAVCAHGELISAFDRVTELARLVRQQNERPDRVQENAAAGLRSGQLGSKSKLELTVTGEVKLTVNATAEGAVRVVIDVGQSDFMQDDVANDTRVVSLDHARRRRTGRS